MFDLAIIGGGPAGLTAGMYATRGGLKNVIMFEKGMPGGQITQSSEIENYPGIPEIVTGIELMEPWPKQCMKFGLLHSMEEVLKINKNKNVFDIMKSDGDVLQAKSVIICTGSTSKKAGFIGEDLLFGKGVSTCATCDGFFYRNKEVAVLGGGDTALEEAIYLTNVCSKVYVIHRRDSFRASPITVEKARNNEKIEFILDSVVEEVYGDKMGVAGAIIKNKKNEIRDLKVPGIFVFVGMNVNNGILKNDDGTFICDVNENGEVIVDLKMKTSLPGLFAAGDIRIDAPKQVVCAAGDGATAAISVLSYIESLND